MKRTLLLLLGLFGLIAWPLSAQLPTTPNYMEGGGAVWNVGGTLDIESGGTLAVKSGATFTNAATTTVTGTTTYSTGTLAIGASGSLTGRQVKKFAKTVWFNLDNGNGTTIDDVITKPSGAITITAARIVYVDATTGTVAAGNAKIGTTLGGAEIVAATSYENSKAVGTSTAMTIVAGAVAANGAVFVRHTGVAATQAGQAFVEIEYTMD